MAQQRPSRTNIARSDVFDTKKTLYFNTSSSSIKPLLERSNIHDKMANGRMYSAFTRTRAIDPYNTLFSTREYVFFTKPDLALVNTNSDSSISPVIKMNQPFFMDAISRYLPVVHQLQASATSINSSPFMHILTNTLTSTLDIPGSSAETIETSGNVMGTTIKYRGTSYKSDENHSFTLEFEETKHLDVYMLFKIYDEYEKAKWDGGLDFALEDRWKEYIMNKVLHDQFSIYKFVVADDGTRLIYWAKLTGCFPTSLPRDAFSDMSVENSSNEPKKISVNFTAQFVREFDPIILDQFNNLVGIDSYNSHKIGYVPITNTDGSVNGSWVGLPFIDTVTGFSRKRIPYDHGEYYLKWMAPSSAIRSSGRGGKF